MEIQPHGLVVLGRGALRQLRRSVLADSPEAGSRHLQEMGYAAGEALAVAFRAWVRMRTGIDRTADLPAERLGSTLSAFLVEAGWGAVEVEHLSEAVLAVDAPDAPEVEPAGGHESPTCYVMAGMLSDLLSRVSGVTVAVMEVECRSLGAGRCRFLVGAPETMQTVYDYVSQGGIYVEAVS